jgi:tight adherence protein B
VRRQCLLLLAFVLAALAFVPGTAAAAAAKAQLSPIPGEVFPDRTFALTLPAGRDLAPGDVQVRENGRPVSRPSVTPAEVAGQEDFGAVLVIDTSASMRGKPIRDALAAAKKFAQQRNVHQKIGLVTFNGTTNVALPLTTDGGAIAGALAKPPPLGNGTHLYDAVARAIALLKEAHIRAGSVLLLSDGRDTNSSLSEADVAASARAAGVRIFTVGLRSESFDSGSLARLAAGAHGDYAQARTSADLGPIYTALGARLANEYLVRYRSLAGMGSAVHVELTATGVPGPITNDYAAPPAGSAQVRPAKATGFWGSSLTMVLVSFLCALLIGLAVVAAMTGRRRRTETVSDRMRGFVAAPPEQPETSSPTLTTRMMGEAERSLDTTSWWPTFKEEVEIAEIKLPAIQIATLTALGTLVLMLLLVSATGSALAGLVALAIPFGVRAFVAHRVDRQRKAFADQLADNLQVIASGMRAGHSFAGALSLAVDDSPEPAKRELARVVADERLGVPIEDTMELVARRMKNDDLRQAVLVATLQRETGGNTAEVIDRIADTIRERAELRRVVRTLTAQGRLSRWVVTALPLGLIAVISLINPGYMDPLFNTATGQLLLALSTGMVIAGSLMIGRIVDFDV